jgi:hypothetical protein
MFDIDTDVLSGGETLVPENACHNYERCGNVVLGNGEVCADCLDAAVANG